LDSVMKTVLLHYMYNSPSPALAYDGV